MTKLMTTETAGGEVQHRIVGGAVCVGGRRPGTQRVPVEGPGIGIGGAAHADTRILRARSPVFSRRAAEKHRFPRRAIAPTVRSCSPAMDVRTTSRRFATRAPERSAPTCRA